MMTERLELALKAVRECRSKRHWDDFLLKFGDVLTSSPTPRLISELFRKLQADPQSLHYDPRLWGGLLNGAIACWNIESGVEIAEFCKKLTSPVVSVPASQIFLEAGKPGVSREFAQRALRLTTITDLDRIQLDLIVASSFAEEGKIDHAVRVLARITALVRIAQMSQRERADFVMRMGRLQYFMGRYPEAAGAFKEAAPTLLDLEDWEGAARALFNAGACIQNSGADKTEEATSLVEQARKLSVEYNLPGPRSHCEAFYGVEAYSKGNFIGAREHFRRAMTVLPASDKSFRRLHIMSFLSFTYFAMGKFALGIKFGRQTIELAALDASERFKTRYQALEAEILWEEGKIPESMQVLKSAVHQLSLHGVKNLEELSTLSRFQIQLSLLGETSTDEYRIDDSLKKDQTQWLEYRYAQALLCGVSDRNFDVITELEDCLKMAKRLDALNHQAYILFLIIKKYLQDRSLEHAKSRLSALEIAVSRLGDTPLRSRLQVIYAAIAYQSGDFDQTFKLLHAVEKMAAVSWVDRFAVTACLATIRGESPRFQHDWHEKLVASFVRSYFAPTLKVLGGKNLVISDCYEVNLEKHPSMAELIQYLIKRATNGATLAQIQTDVWHESVNAQGWQQKIRNAVMRIRDLCPYTIAPILIHNDNLRFFNEAITVMRDDLEGLSMDLQVQAILKQQALSSQQVADKMHVSLATAKRLLKKMSLESQVKISKEGRNVVYSSS
jgi:tetratricopeptide (TPR) repeat protein